MEIIGIILTIAIGLISGGFIGASTAHILSYKKEYEKDSFGQVFRKMIQPIIFFLLVYGVTYFIRGESGLLLGAVAGAVPFVMNYRATVQQRHAKYSHLALDAKGDVQASTDSRTLRSDEPSDKSYADTIVKAAESSAGTLRDRFKCTDTQSAQAAVQLAGISLVVVGRRLKQDGVDEGTRQRLLKELMSKVANNTSISPAQPKAELLAMINEYRWFMSSPLSREAADELTRHGFMVMIAKTIAGDDEVSARSRAGVAVDKMVSLGWSANLSKLESSL